jgi:hypothetical protein
MKLWIDEDLSPSLVDIAHRHGLDATCNRDRALLGRSDTEVMRHCIDEDRTLVTNNLGDFAGSASDRPYTPAHRPSNTIARGKQQLLGIALAYIEEQVTLSIAADQGEFMINRVIEVSETGSCADYPLPAT